MYFFKVDGSFFFPGVVVVVVRCEIRAQLSLFLPNNMKMAAAFFLVVMLRTYVIPCVASSVALFAEMIQCERYVCPSYSIRGGGEETKMFFIRQPWRSLCIGAF